MTNQFGDYQWHVANKHRHCVAAHNLHEVNYHHYFQFNRIKSVLSSHNGTKLSWQRCVLCNVCTSCQTNKMSFPAMCRAMCRAHNVRKNRSVDTLVQCGSALQFQVGSAVWPHLTMLAAHWTRPAWNQTSEKLEARRKERQLSYEVVVVNKICYCPLIDFHAEIALMFSALFHGRTRTAYLYRCVWSGITGR